MSHSAAADPPKKEKPVRQIKLPKGVKVPPDIQAIIDKQNAGGTLTMEDIQKLQAWAAGVANNLPVNGPVSPTDPSKRANPDEKPGITVPARIDLSAHYTRKSGSTLDTFTISESTNLDLLAKIHGTDDYASHLLDPNANVSTFYFQPGATPGTGQYHFHQDASGSVDFVATMSQVTGGAMLVTMGGDTLGIIPGQLNGEVAGNYHNVAHDGKASDRAYNGQMRESLLDLLFPWEAHTTKDKSKPNPKPRAQISYKRIVDAIQSGKTTPIKVTEHFEWNDHGEQVVGDVDVTITLRPGPPQREVRIEQVGDWYDWKPEGPTPNKDHGNTFGLKIQVYDGATPSTKKPVKVVYKLKNVTRLPGVCTNWPQPALLPASSKAKEDFDLFFAESNANGRVDKDRQTLQLDGAHTTDVATIESRDFGAYGEVTATVTMPGEAPFDATFSENKQPFVTLPRDDNHNKIADAWENGRTLDPTADDESTGGYKTKGDGFTVMEEYRGFLLSPKRVVLPEDGTVGDEKHERLDPDVRELIVLLDIDSGRLGVVERGLELFETAGDVKVYTLASKQRTGPHGGDNGRQRSIVFNPTPVGSANAEQSRDTVGVWITSKALTPGKSIARAWPARDDVNCDDHPDQCIGSPLFMRYVALGADTSASQVEWMASMIDPDDKGGGPNTKAARLAVDAYLRRKGVDFRRRREAARLGRANVQELAAELTGFSIGHELMHVFGAQHHGVFDHNELKGRENGPDNCPMRYWHQLNSKKETVETPDPTDPTQTIETENWLGFNGDPENVMEWFDFLTGKWNPLDRGPSGPWTICGDNWSQMTMKP